MGRPLHYSYHMLQHLFDCAHRSIYSSDVKRVCVDQGKLALKPGSQNSGVVTLASTTWPQAGPLLARV